MHILYYIHQHFLYLLSANLPFKILIVISETVIVVVTFIIAVGWINIFCQFLTVMPLDSKPRHNILSSLFDVVQRYNFFLLKTFLTNKQEEHNPVEGRNLRQV